MEPRSFRSCLLGIVNSILDGSSPSVDAGLPLSGCFFADMTQHSLHFPQPSAGFALPMIDRRIARIGGNFCHVAFHAGYQALDLLQGSLASPGHLLVLDVMKPAEV